MARPTTKEQLLQAANDNFEKLFKLIESMSVEEQSDTFLFDDRDRNIRDVLIHLYEWHQLLLHWIESNNKGESKTFLPEPYNWKTYPQMNIEFWNKHQSTQLNQAISFLKESHAKAIKSIESFSNEELFTNKYFNWTGTTSLGSYCVSSTASHYDWAVKKIRKQIKAKKAK